MWAHCMLSDSMQAPLLCPEDLAENAAFFLQSYFGLTVNEIKHTNCKQVYIAFVDFLSHL